MSTAIGRLKSAAVLLFLVPVSLVRAQECGPARDLMNRALERIRSHNSKEELEDALQLLKLSTQQCAESGDAWYYRSLFERRLGLDPIAKRSLHQAELMTSDAMRQGLDPFTLSTPVNSGEALTSKVHDKWALVIGIGQFQDPSIPALAYTAQDAKSFADLLKDKHQGRFKPDHVHLLQDKQATTAEIRKQFNWLVDAAQPDDLAVLFISSHGSAREAGAAKNVNYVLTYDTNAANPGDLYLSAVSMVEVTSVIRNRVKALRAAVFLDTCFSGAASESLRDAPAAKQVLDQIREGSGRAIVASSDVNQSSQESDTLKHGYFTFNLLHALTLENGMQPLSKVFDYLRTTVATQVYAEKHKQQTPVMARSDRGADIVIGVATGT